MQSSTHEAVCGSSGFSNVFIYGSSYMISGLLPLEAEIHTRVFTMFGNITRAHKNSTEWKLAERQPFGITISSP
jgi:hypothetical protein